MRKHNDEDIARLLLDNRRIFDEHFEPAYAKALVHHVMRPINTVYFRPRFVGFEAPIERARPEAPAILCSNHSGMAFPWDGMVFLSALLMHKGYDERQIPRTIAAPMLSQTVLMNPFMVPGLWKRCGGIDATFLNFETMMHYRESNLMVYPEGVPGIGKGFNRKYQLQRLATSFVRMALKYRSDIVPFATVNGEYINPYMYSSRRVNRFANLLGIPYIPVGPLTIALLLQPWTFYLAFPAQLTFVRGQRIRPYEWTDKAYEDLTQEDIEAIRDRIHAQMQAELSAAVAAHGQKPYRWGEFLRAAWRQRRYFPFYLPFGWPFWFREFERQWQTRRPEDIRLPYGLWGLLKMLWRHPILIAFFIPVLGWLPLAFLGYSKKQQAYAGDAG